MTTQIATYKLDTVFASLPSWSAPTNAIVTELECAN